MERSGHWNKAFDGAWLLAWGLASSLWCVTAAGQLGATFDEPIYVARGLDFWHLGSHQGLMKLGTMPLAIDLDIALVGIRGRKAKVKAQRPRIGIAVPP